MPVPVQDPYRAVERRVARRLRDDDAHRRVANALAEVAMSALYPARHVQGTRMTGPLEDPVESATRVAVETLIDELEDLVEALPPTALDQLYTEQMRGDLGVE